MAAPDAALAAAYAHWMEQDRVRLPAQIKMKVPRLVVTDPMADSVV